MFKRSNLSNFISDQQKKDVVSVFASVNEAKISIADKEAKDAKAYICTMNNGQNQFDIFVFFELIKTNEILRYISKDSPIFLQELTEKESASLDFVERLGFMMNNLEISRLNDTERDVFLSRLCFFEKTNQQTKASSTSVYAQSNEPDGDVKAQLKSNPKIKGQHFDENERRDLYEFLSSF